MALIADKACKLLGIEGGKNDRRVSAILVSIVKSENKYIYCGLIVDFYRHSNDLNVCELKGAYCRSRYQLRISGTDPVILQKIVAWMGDGDAYGTMTMNTSGFSVSPYKEWHNAKYCKLDVKMFDKVSTIQSPGGKSCAVEVVDGNASDSPSLRQLPPLRSPWHGQRLPDFAASAIWQKYEHGNDEFYKLIESLWGYDQISQKTYRNSMIS